ncbi:MAG: ABC transporter ATP-binding protein [Actinomycetaceae bacterium]|nr:ABC transporter ATP-binding protein [Actinomycetaceae bacterium]
MTRQIPIALALLSSVALCGSYLMVGAGIDAALTQRDFTSAFIIASVCALLAGFATFAVGRICTSAIGIEEKSARRRLLRHVFALGVAQRTSERAGRIVNTMTDGVERHALHTSSFIGPMIASLATPALVIAIIAISLDWVTALILAIAIPVVPASVVAFQMAFKSVSAKYRASSRALAAQELDAIQGLGTLARMNAGRAMSATLARAAEEVRIRVMRYLAGNQLVLLVVDAVFSLGMVTAAAALALWRMEAGVLSPGGALALVLLSTIMLDPLDRIGQFFYIGMGGMAAGREMKTFLAEVPATKDEDGVRIPHNDDVADGRIDIDNLHFRWDNEVPVLEGAHLHIDHGEHLVIRGVSGAGKSTLSALLQGHQRPESGTIRIEGIDMQSAPLAWLRSRIAVVEQTTYLFSGTLRDNLLIASPNATDNDLLQALSRAHLDDLMARLPEGLDTPVGQRGLALSGGEAQRLAIARALLKDAPIMLLDEPTAHVDLASERLILEALSDVTKGRTTLTISHRNATIASGSRVVELTQGKLQ